MQQWITFNSVLIYISLLIIFCIIEYVTNKRTLNLEPWITFMLREKMHTYSNFSYCEAGKISKSLSSSALRDVTLLYLSVRVRGANEESGGPVKCSSITVQ